MRRHAYLWALLVASSSAVIIASVQYSGATRSAHHSIGRSRSAGAAAFSLVMPAAFTPNAGQYDPSVRFAARGAHQAVFATDRGVTLAVTSQTRGLALRLTFVGASPTLRVEPAKPAQTRINYFSGRDPAAWRSNLPTFGEIRYRDVWPGVDAAVAVQPDRLK